MHEIGEAKENGKIQDAKEPECWTVLHWSRQKEINQTDEPEMSNIGETHQRRKQAEFDSTEFQKNIHHRSLRNSRERYQKLPSQGSAKSRVLRDGKVCISC